MTGSLEPERKKNQANCYYPNTDCNVREFKGQGGVGALLEENHSQKKDPIKRKEGGKEKGVRTPNHPKNMLHTVVTRRKTTYP